MSKKSKNPTLYKSYAKRAATYFACMKANPKMSMSAVYKRYEHTPLGIRKTDFFPLARNLKEAIKYGKALDSSGMRDKEALKDLKNTAYRYAKKDTDRYHKENPLKLGEVQPGVIDLVKNTFARDGNYDHYINDEPIDFGYEPTPEDEDNDSSVNPDDY